jgi:tetratricopeptide (TPR) repeat protein
VALFVEYATMSKAAFTLTGENTSDVIEICRRLDGLPLAIELVASRSKLLTPRALLGRLDKALDLSTQASGRPGRQQSLRQAIAWSYDILPPPMQRGFAALSVFAGEVTLEDCEAVLPREVRASYDVLDLVAELQDASLVVVGENPTGDPTVGMLETIRAFAREMLQASGDDAEVRDSHVDHYADLALRLIEEADHGEDASLRHTWPLDNVRIALAWCLSTPEPTARRLEQSVALARVVLLLGNDLGIHTEARTWFEQLLPHVRALDTENTISVILGLAATCRMEGALERSYQLTEQALETPGIDNYPDLHRDALGMSGRVALDMLDLEAAREKLTRGRVLISESDKARIAFWELSMADLESACGDEIGAIPRFRSALALFESLNDEFRALVVRHNLACALRRLGQVPEALAMFRAELEQNLALPAPLHHASFAEDFGACLAMAGHCEYAAQLWGAAETTRRVHDVPRDPGQEAEIGDAYAIARAALADDRWHQAILTGQGASLDDLIREVDGHLD